ncbi:1-deoxyxylulose-5-phosphate synthase YajO-like [Gigantopelta aegis]|uniref:1-deoxyxylulose-5-phosphate synthase YajO-like n=1 Tax=Gigantopelta aegis TaxID=1735272 RepID=UPI001B8888D4|nr:1-deoxyxylulose-5-phosphate synthase YajO-like [Gigantopelta aegis]
MQHVTLPGTDLKVSQLCHGCWQFNNNTTTVNWDAQPLEVSKSIVDKCFDVGINFFDTAQGYAGSEEVLGECLQGRRQNAVIATKYGFREGVGTPPYSALDIQEAIETALKKLKTTYIDILQIHFPSFVKDKDETITELKRQIGLGKIRYYGVSNYGPKNLREFLAAGAKPVVNQMGYNLLWRSVEDEVLPICKENNISVLAYSTLQQGLLTGKFHKLDDIPEGRRRGKLFKNTEGSNKLARHGQEGAEEEMIVALGKIQEICNKAGVTMSQAAISWLLQQDGVDSVITGASTPQQVVTNSNIVKLSQDVVKQLSEVTEPVKAKIGKTLDQWATPDRCE